MHEFEDRFEIFFSKRKNDPKKLGHTVCFKKVRDPRVKNAAKIIEIVLKMIPKDPEQFLLFSVDAKGFPRKAGVSTTRARELYKSSLAKILPSQKVEKMSTHSSKRGGCQQLWRNSASGEVIDGHCGFKSVKSKMSYLDNLELSQTASELLHM